MTLPNLADDWIYLLLRLLFIGLIYLFIWQVFRANLLELRNSARAAPAARRSTKPRLIVVDPAESGLSPGHEYVLKAKTTLGRHPDCVISIDEPFLSAYHAEIERAQNTYSVRDLGSTNGTFVRGQAAQVKTDVRSGDIVQFGRMTFRFVV